MHVNHTARKSVFIVSDNSVGGQCRSKIIYRQQLIACMRIHINIYDIKISTRLSLRVSSYSLLCVIDMIKKKLILKM